MGELENIVLEYLRTNNKAIPKTGKRSVFEILKEIYKNEDRTNFLKRAAVEQLHVELYANIILCQVITCVYGKLNCFLMNLNSVCIVYVDHSI